MSEEGTDADKESRTLTDQFLRLAPLPVGLRRLERIATEVGFEPTIACFRGRCLASLATPYESEMNLARFERAASTSAGSRSNSAELQVQRSGDGAIRTRTPSFRGSAP